MVMRFPDIGKVFNNALWARGKDRSGPWEQIDDSPEESIEFYKRVNPDLEFVIIKNSSKDRPEIEIDD